MRVPAAVVAFLSLFAMVVVPQQSEAVPIQVWVDNVAVPVGGPGTDTVTLATGGTWTTYGNLKIKASGNSGTAKVMAGDGSAGGEDATKDGLKFVNAEIRRANTTVPTDNTVYHIVYEGTFNNLPNSDTQPFSYELSGAGSIRFTAGNSAQATGMIESSSGIWTTIGPLPPQPFTVAGANYVFFPAPNMASKNFPSPAPESNPSVNATRKLKVDFAFKLQKITDYLTIASAGGIMLHNGPAHGPGDSGRMRPPNPLSSEDFSRLRDQVDMLELMQKYILGAEKIQKLLPPVPAPDPEMQQPQAPGGKKTK